MGWPFHLGVDIQYLHQVIGYRGFPQYKSFNSEMIRIAKCTLSLEHTVDRLPTKAPYEIMDAVISPLM